MKKRNFSADILIFFSVMMLMMRYNCSEYYYPRFDTRPINITAIAGQTKTLPCSVENKMNYSVAWMNPKKILISQGDRRLMDDIRMTIERPLVPDWNLHIRSVRYSDHGMYTCSLNTKPVKIKRIYLTVLVQPDINEYWSSQDQVVREGSTVHLTCNATGKPQPEITWYRKTTYSTKENKEVIGTPGEILVIHNITRYCDGVYECVASNGVGAAASKEINIEVQFPPEVHLLNKKISQKLGKETILSCIISASPQAMGVWLKGGRTIEPRWNIRTEIYEDSPHTVTLNLRIMNIEEKDFGHYTCEASNNLGGDSESMFLYEEKPKTTTTLVYFTEDIITSRPIYHEKQIDANQVPPIEHYYNDIPKDPVVYQYAGDNESSKTCIDFILFYFIITLYVAVI